MARKYAAQCEHLISRGTPLEPPEYCGDEADNLTLLCLSHQQAWDEDDQYDHYREATRF